MTENGYDERKIKLIIQAAFKEIKSKEASGYTKDTAINNIVRSMKEILKDENKQNYTD